MRTTRTKPVAAALASLLMAVILAFGSAVAPAAAKTRQQIIDVFNGVNKFRKSEGHSWTSGSSLLSTTRT